MVLGLGHRQPDRHGQRLRHHRRRRARQGRLRRRDASRPPTASRSTRHSEKTTQAISEDVAADTSYALQQVTTSGTGTNANTIGRPVAGKTGTATDDEGNVRSSWFVGYTPQLATAVMYSRGNGNEPLDDYLPTFYGGEYPARTWAAVMSRALEGQEILEFPEPAFLEQTVEGHEPTPTVEPDADDVGARADEVAEQDAAASADRRAAAAVAEPAAVAARRRRRRPSSRRSPSQRAARRRARRRAASRRRAVDVADGEAEPRRRPREPAGASGPRVACAGGRSAGGAAVVRPTREDPFVRASSEVVGGPGRPPYGRAPVVDPGAGGAGGGVRRVAAGDGPEGAVRRGRLERREQPLRADVLLRRPLPLRRPRVRRGGAALRRLRTGGTRTWSTRCSSATSPTARRWSPRRCTAAPDLEARRAAPRRRARTPTRRSRPSVRTSSWSPRCCWRRSCCSPPGSSPAPTAAGRGTRWASSPRRSLVLTGLVNWDVLRDRLPGRRDVGLVARPAACSRRARGARHRGQALPAVPARRAPGRGAAAPAAAGVRARPSAAAVARGCWSTCRRCCYGSTAGGASGASTPTAAPTSARCGWWPPHAGCVVHARHRSTASRWWSSALVCLGVLVLGLRAQHVAAGAAAGVPDRARVPGRQQGLLTAVRPVAAAAGGARPAAVARPADLAGRRGLLLRDGVDVPRRLHRAGHQRRARTSPTAGRSWCGWLAELYLVVVVVRDILRPWRDPVRLSAGGLDADPMSPEPSPE